MALGSLAGGFASDHGDGDLFSVPHSSAVSTSSRHEKKVAQQLLQKGVTCFLPLRESERRWRNGKRAVVQFPLFSGYVFVNIPLCESLNVLNTSGVVRFVWFGGSPVFIPDEQISALTPLVESRVNCEPHPYLRAGERVAIKAGPLRGVCGILVRHRDKCKVVLSIDLLQRSVAVEVDADCVEPVLCNMC